MLLWIKSSQNGTCTTLIVKRFILAEKIGLFWEMNVEKWKWSGVYTGKHNTSLYFKDFSRIHALTFMWASSLNQEKQRYRSIWRHVLFWARILWYTRNDCKVYYFSNAIRRSFHIRWSVSHPLSNFWAVKLYLSMKWAQWDLELKKQNTLDYFIFLGSEYSSTKKTPQKRT